jgi:hypothetical protein
MVKSQMYLLIFYLALLVSIQAANSNPSILDETLDHLAESREVYQLSHSLLRDLQEGPIQVNSFLCRNWKETYQTFLSKLENCHRKDTINKYSDCYLEQQKVKLDLLKDIHNSCFLGKKY